MRGRNEVSLETYMIIYLENHFENIIANIK